MTRAWSFFSSRSSHLLVSIPGKLSGGSSDAQVTHRGFDHAILKSPQGEAELRREGRWNDAQLVPAEYVRLCARQSPYNPHYPYSLQFNVNTEGGLPELPGDAFWKGGSGGHALYVVPSPDLVVWKLGGRDDQYSPDNTGLPASPASKERAAARRNWKATVDQETALRKTLELVVKAIVP